MLRTFLLVLVCLAVSACAVFTEPMNQPVIEDKLNRRMFERGVVGTLSLTPERRIVLVNFDNNRFCAEAPTEVGIDLAAVQKVAASIAKAPGVETSAEALSALGVTNIVLNERSQGLQLFLANAYFVCQMYLNGGVSEAQVLEAHFRALLVAAPLVEKELPYIHASKNGEQQKAASPPPGRAEVDKAAKDVTKDVLDKTNEAPGDAESHQAPSQQ